MLAKCPECTSRNDDSNFIIIKHRMGNTKNDLSHRHLKLLIPSYSIQTDTLAQKRNILSHTEKPIEILRPTDRDPFQHQTFSSAQTLTRTDHMTNQQTVTELSCKPLWSDSSRVKQTRVFCQRTAFSFHRLSGLSACYCVENRAVQAEMTAEEMRRN